MVDHGLDKLDSDVLADGVVEPDQPGVNFIHILITAFTGADSKSAKRYRQLD